MQENTQNEKKVNGNLRTFIVGVLTVVAALVANLVIRALAFAIWPISPIFLPLKITSIGAFTIVLVGGSALIYMLVSRFSRQPTRIFTCIALIALLLSCVPNALLFLNPDTRMWPGITPLAITILIVLHVVDAIIVIMMLTRFAPSKGRPAKA
ncbi:DUF6069 family protein [Ktedonospora formicarum]|uniref:Uncharacterized protein n=1 Tax=Ktedonospora formicarum TaxID=2778364 RepID=A0A8J3I5E6_9CHLR|nr:DUF6069 family protein [Ktedonospora formicarum]GHO47746.1 hypothetical protein KSX_59090 [Ktedonospora formicarum]